MSKHQIIEQIQKKQEPVLHVLNIMLIIKMSKHPIIDQRLKQKPDLRLRGILVHYQQYHHSLQVKHHLEVKRNRKIIILSRIMNLKENNVDHQMLEQIIRQNRTQNITQIRMRIEPEHIGEKQKEYTYKGPVI